MMPTSLPIFLSLFIDEGDPGELALAIGIVARVRGMAQIAEETGIGRQDFTIIQNTYPISETFFGSNQVHYCHKYYLAICNNGIEVEMNTNNLHMVREIGDIKWCSLDDAISKIRPDNIEKREILLKAGKIMRNFHPVHTNDLPRSYRS